MNSQGILVTVLCAIICVSCGGGSGSGSDSLNPPTPLSPSPDDPDPADPTPEEPSPDAPAPNEPVPEPDPDPGPETLEAAEQALFNKINQTNGPANYSLILGNADGAFFTAYNNSHGDQPRVIKDTMFNSASAAKLVSATVIMYFVEQGYLSRDDKVYEHIDFWSSTGDRSKITLKHLLTMSSGLVQNEARSPCLQRWLAVSHEECVRAIHFAAGVNMSEPGAAIHYGGDNYRVAGLMAVRAVGVGSWHELFDRFKREVNVLASSLYSRSDIPSVDLVINPSVEGGLMFRADEYFDFLVKLDSGQILRQATFDSMLVDQTVGKPLDYLPGKKYGHRLGLGIFIECREKKEGTELDCADIVQDRYASPGGYGSYPFIDRRDAYLGILAMEEPHELSTWGSGRQGANMVREMNKEITELVRLQP